MQALLIIAAESISIDQNRNTLSIFHILEELSIPAFPVVLPYAFMLAILERTADETNTPNDLHWRVQFGNQELLRNPIPVNFQGRTRMRVISQIGGLVIAGPGSMVFSVYNGDEELGTWKVPIANIGQPVVQTELPLNPV